MAIKKSIKTKLGIDATYWNIGACKLDSQKDGKIIIKGRLDGYVSAEVYQEGAEPISNIFFNLTGNKEDTLTYEGLYKYIIDNVEEMKGGEEI